MEILVRPSLSLQELGTVSPPLSPSLSDGSSSAPTSPLGPASPGGVYSEEQKDREAENARHAMAVQRLEERAAAQMAAKLQAAEERQKSNSVTPATVSRPANVQRVLHVEWDDELQAFTGVPDVWKEHMPQSTRYLNSDDLPIHVAPSISCLPQTQSSLCAPKKMTKRHSLTGEFTVTAEGTIVEHIAERKNTVSRGGKYPSLPKNFRWKRKGDQISIRDYLALMGFSDLDKVYKIDALRDALISKLSVGSGGAFLIRMPVVLKLKVFGYLDAASLVAVSSTCTELLQYGDHQLLWKPLVHMKNLTQRTLFSEKSSIMNDWKRTHMAMQHLDVDPKYFDFLWNIVVIGDRRVGKSRLVWSLAESANKARDHKHTVTADDPVISPVSGIYRLGIDFVTRRVVIGSTVIKLQVWDGNALVGGGERIPFQNTHVALVVFDVCNKPSFDRIPAIIEETRREMAVQQQVIGNVPILLFANITERERVVSYKDAKRFANERGMVYLEANALDPESVDTAFAHLAEECIHFSFLDSQTSARVLRQGNSKLSPCSVM